MRGFNHQDLTIEIDDSEDAVVRLDWVGKSNARDPVKVLKPFFDSVLAEAHRRSATALEMHFERIDHFNSSTITALIHLIQNTRGAQLPLVLVFDGGRRWQKLSFDALRVFEKPDGLLAIREQG